MRKEKTGTCNSFQARHTLDVKVFDDKKLIMKHAWNGTNYSWLKNRRMTGVHSLEQIFNAVKSHRSYQLAAQACQQSYHARVKNHFWQEKKSPQPLKSASDRQKRLYSNKTKKATASNRTQLTGQEMRTKQAKDELTSSSRSKWEDGKRKWPSGSGRG